jgi:hypothetical protein
MGLGSFGDSDQLNLQKIVDSLPMQLLTGAE